MSSYRDRQTCEDTPATIAEEIHGPAHTWQCTDTCIDYRIHQWEPGTYEDRPHHPECPFGDPTNAPYRPLCDDESEDALDRGERCELPDLYL
jgi:hypothetical protein